MTPTRFAILVLVTAILLPISPNPSAVPTRPDADLLTATPSATLSVKDIARSALAEPRLPVYYGQGSVDCKCLYIDWWYDTLGMWVYTVDSPNDPALHNGRRHKVIAIN